MGRGGEGERIGARKRRRVRRDEEGKSYHLLCSFSQTVQLDSL